MEQLHLELEQKQEELIKLNTKLVVLSVTDELTGLNNRRFFMEKLKEYYLIYQQTDIPFSLLIIDIDHFKLVNDTWGHSIGDKVLIKVAQILTAFFQKEDVVARYGGEEFVVIMPVEDEEESIKVAERLRVAIQTADWELGKITVSIGVATSNPNDTDISILATADKALYTSKENGRNRVTHAKYLSYTE
jgi:diguanylate cyclase